MFLDGNGEDADGIIRRTEVENFRSLSIKLALAHRGLGADPKAGTAVSGVTCPQCRSSQGTRLQRSFTPFLHFTLPFM